MAVSTHHSSRPPVPSARLADFARQLAIWFGFAAVYQVARGFADRDPANAFANGLRVIDFEQQRRRRSTS